MLCRVVEWTEENFRASRTGLCQSGEMLLTDIAGKRRSGQKKMANAKKPEWVLPPGRARRATCLLPSMQQSFYGRSLSVALRHFGSDAGQSFLQGFWLEQPGIAAEPENPGNDFFFAAGLHVQGDGSVLVDFCFLAGAP